MSSANQEGEFTEVHRKREKRKTSSSPTLPSTLQRTRSSELPPETPTRPKTSSYKNQIPVILSGIDEKFQTWRQVMGELRQHHPSLRISMVKALKKGDLLVVGDSPQVEEFRQPVSVRRCFNCQCFGHSAQNCKSKQKCVICGENHSHKGCPQKEAKQPKCANCSGPHVASYKGCPEYKKQAFRQHVVNHQKSYAAAVSQNSHSQPKNTQTFQFTAEQLTKFVANVAIQIAQPQVCYPNPKQDMLDLKSSMCRKVFNVAKTILGVNVTGKELFESIGSLSAPAPPRPFTFTGTKVNSGSKTISKPSTSKSTSPPKTSTNAVPKKPISTN